MNGQQALEYYSRKDVADSIAKSSKDREVAGCFVDGSYDSRPNMIQFPNDVLQMAKKGITSFHFSVERWSSPMALKQGNYDRLRKGWDLLIDIDSKLGLDDAKAAALLICRLLKRYGIRPGIKFSGRRGFHICVPWESMPKEIDYKPMQALYPSAARILTAYIRKRIAKRLMRELIKSKGESTLMESLGEPGNPSPFYFVEVEKDWGVRHMFRAPYSLNEKTWLVSIPINFAELKSFDKETARPEKISVDREFFAGEENAAESLFLDAMDWHALQKKDEKKHLMTPSHEGKISEELFPPCMRLVLGGLHDGRKRSLFLLINFLRKMNWTAEETEERIFAWNEKNTPPLPRSYVLGQLRYGQQRDTMLPANCSAGIYTDIGICRPDAICMGGGQAITVRNPVNYPFRIIKKRKKTAQKKQQGFSCLCGNQFPTARGLEMHKGRMH